MSQQPYQPPAPPQPMPPEQRKQQLGQVVAQEVARGSRVESQSDFQAVLVKGKPVNHILHLILTVLTCSVWSLVWLALAVLGGEKRKVIAVDDYGHIQRR